MTPVPAPQLPEHLLRNARILPQRDFMLGLLPKGGVFVEVGVALGGYTRKVLDTVRPDKFIAIDLFDLHTLPELWGKPTSETFGGRTHEAFFRDQFAGEIASGRMEVLAGDSHERIRELDDGSVDIFYVDADHRYEYVSRELTLLPTKTKPDGWIILNDYTFLENVGSKAEYGVIQAANEFMVRENWEMVFFALERFGFYDVALRRCQTTG